MIQMVLLILWANLNYDNTFEEGESCRTLGLCWNYSVIILWSIIKGERLIVLTPPVNISGHVII